MSSTMIANQRIPIIIDYAHKIYSIKKMKKSKKTKQIKVMKVKTN